jgi:hypothetical protein
MKKNLTLTDKVVNQRILHANILFYTKIAMGLAVLGLAVYGIIFNH